MDSRRATILYWSSLALVTATVLIPRLPPLADYPQHLALADVARRLMDPAAPEHQIYGVWFLTYNGLFHFLVSRLSVVLPIELAGRIVVALALAGLGAAILALLRSLGRPASHAFLFVPALFSFAVSWGFINHALCLALATTALVCVVHSLLRPSWKAAVATALLSVLCGFAHVLVTAVLCILAASLAPELAWRSVQGRNFIERIRRAAARAVVALAPLLAGGAYCIVVFVQQYRWDPDSYTDAALEGTSPPLWKKLLLFGHYATGAHWDKSDTVLVWLSVVLMLAITVIARQQRRSGVAPSHPAPVFGPLLAMTAAYLAMPMVFIGTHLVFPRMAQFLLLAAVLSIPALSGAVARRVENWARALAVITGLNLTGHAVGHAFETNAASRVIDALPEGRRVSAVVYDAGGISFQHSSLVHLAAYYGTRKQGDWAYSFARFASVPVYFKIEQPLWPSRGWEFRPANYNPRCNYARVYDVVVVAVPRRFRSYEEQAVRRLVFKQDAAIPRLLAREGRFWAFDTAGVPSDGSF